jgi:hypothetical protein
VKKLFPLLLIAGCATEPETKTCADYGSHTFMKDKCLPLYGALICADSEVTEADSEVTEVYCKRYFDEEDNGDN